MAGLLSGSSTGSRGFRRIVGLLIALVIVPTGCLLAVGILQLVFWRAELNILFGILVMALVACLVTGTVLSLVLIREEAKLSKLQTDFVSKVSHELRTPLTSIRMFAEMLHTQRDPQQVEICLEVLEKETARLSERIERLLDWGRMEAGRRVYERRRERVHDIVQDALRAFNTAYVGRNQEVEVEVEVEPGLPDVEADRGAMVDALLNLMSNAFKYSGDRCRIWVRAAAEAKAVKISVRDNGIGVPRGEQKAIFQKFYRSDDRLARSVEGSGLGLPIVRHVVSAHRGRITLESEVGKGSTFTIALPILAASATEAERGAEPEPAELHR